MPEWRRITVRCPGSGCYPVELAVLDEDRGTCRACGAVRWLTRDWKLPNHDQETPHED